MNASTRNALRHLEQQHAAQPRDGAALPRWIRAMAPARPRPLWQRAVAAVVALTMFMGPLSATVEQSRRAAGLLAAHRAPLSDDAWRALTDLAGLRIRFAMQAAQAAPIVDPAAPIAFRPTLTQSTGLGGGVPVVNISAPNAAGISLNQYQSFNIDPVGLILNNSQMAGTSLTGGDVRANPNLGGRTASVIVNQVTATGNGYASLLNGPLEVFGSPAAVVIANPNGITTRGAGFTNTIGVTLSTGAPQFLSDLNGARSDFAQARAIGYDVVGGRVQIEGNAGVNGPGAGIEGTVGTIDLIGETIGVNAPLYAGNRINAVAGRQFVLPSASDATGTTYTTNANGARNAADAIAAANGRAIDATAFGAMTAGQIQVISTAAGMGVRADAQLAANAGDLVLSSNGDVSIAGSAAQQQATIRANGQVEMRGAQLGVAGFTVQANGDVTSTGTLQSGGRLDVKAGGRVALANAQAEDDVTIAGGPGVTLGDVQTNKRLDVSARTGDGSGDIRLDGTVLSRDDTTLRAARDLAVAGQLGARALRAEAGRSLDVSGRMQTTGDLALHAAGDIVTRGPVASGGQLTLDAGRDVAAGGLLQAAGDLRVRAGNNASVADTRSGGVLDLSARGGADGGDLTFNGVTQATGATRLQSARDLVVNGTLAGGAALTVEAGRDVTVGAQGTVQASGDLALTAQTGSVTSRGALTGARDLTVSGGRDVALLGATGAIGAARVSAGRDLTVGGTFAGRDGARLTAGRDAALGGTSAVSKDLAVEAARDLAVTGAAQGANVTLTGGRAITLNDVQSSGALQATARTGGLAIDGTVTSQASATLASGGDLAVRGALQSADRLSLTSGGGLSIDGKAHSLATGKVSAAGALDVRGVLQTTGALDLDSGGAATIGGTVNALSSATLKSTGDATVNGLLQSAGPLSVTGGAATSVGGTVLSTGDLTLTNAAGSLTSTGTIAAGNDLRIDAAHTVDLGRQATAAQRDLSIKAGGDLRADGTVTAQRDGTLDAGGRLGGGGALGIGRAAELHSGGDTQLTGTLRGDTVHARADGSASLHDVQAASALTLDAAHDLRTTGGVVGNAEVTLQAGKDLDTNGSIQATRDLTLTAGQNLSATGALRTHQDLHVQAGNHAGVADALVDGKLDARALGGDLSFNGVTQIAGATDLKAARDVNVNGALTSGAALSADAGLDVTVGKQATLQAGGDLALNARAGNVSAHGVLIGARDVTVTAAQDVTLDGATRVFGEGRVNAGRDLTVGGSLAGQGGARLTAGRDAVLGGTTGVLRDLTVDAGRDLAVTGAAVGAGVTLTGGGAVALNDVQSNAALQVKARERGLTINGTVTSLSSADLASGGDLAVHGALRSAGGANLTSGGALAIDGVLSTLSSATLKATGDTTLNGVLQSAGPLSATGGAATRIGGIVHSGGDLALTNAAGSLTSTGTIEAGNDLRIDAAQAVDLGRQATTAQRDMTIHAGGDLRADGTVIAQRDGTLDAGGQLGGAGTLAFGRAAALHSDGDTRLTGTLRGDTVQVRADGAAAVHDVLAVSSAALEAQRDLDLTGALRSGGGAALQAGANLGVTGALQTAGDASLTATQGRIATSGPLASNGALDLRAGTDITLAGATGAARGMTIEAGREVAATGGLTVLSGDLRIGAGNGASVADVQAGGGFHLDARGGDAQFNGTTAAVGLTEVKAARDVLVTGALAGGGDGASASHAATTVRAGRDVRVAGMLAGGAQLGVDAARDVSVDAAGHLQAAGDLTLAARAGGVTATGTLAGERDVAIDAARDLALTGKTSIGGDATLHAGRDLALGGTVAGKGGAKLDAGQDLTLGGAVGIARDVDAQAGRDLAVTGALQGNAVTLTAARAIALKDVQSASALKVDARGGALRLDGIVNTLGAGSLKSAGDLNLNGQLQSAGNLATTSGGKTTLAGALNAGAKASLDAAGDLEIGGALRATGPLLAKSGGALKVGGKVESASSGVLSAARDLTIDGTLATTDALDLTSGGRTTLAGSVSSLAGGALHAAGDVTVNGRLDTRAPLSITSGGDTTVGGALISGGDLTLRNAAGAFTSSGTLQADGALSIDAARVVDLGAGRTTALGDLDVSTRGNLTANGTVLAQGAGALTAGGALGGAANLGFGKDATLRAGGDLNLTGALSGRAVDVRAEGAATLHDVSAAGAMTLAAAGTLTTTGMLDGKTTVALTAGRDLAQRGALQAQGDASLTARQGRVESTGPVKSGGALALKAGTDIALAGTATAGADTTLDAGQALTVTVTGALTSHGGLDAKAGTDLGIAGTVVVDHDATLSTARDLGVSGGLSGHGKGRVGAGRDLNGAGTIAFAQTAALEAGRDVDQRGLIQGRRVQVTAAGGAAVKDVQADETLALSATGAQPGEHAGDLRIDGTATAGGAVRADAQRDLQVAGKLKGGATVEASAQRNLKVEGAVQSSADMTLSARGGDLTATGGINSGGALGATAGQDLRLGATTSAVGDATLAAGRDLDLGAGLLIGDANGSLRADRDLRGTGTQSFTQGAFDAAAGQDLALGGRVQAQSVRAQGGRDATLHDVASATTLDLIAQGKNGGGDATITGEASAKGAVTLDAARDARVSGALENGAAQTLNAQRDVIVSGTTQAKGDLKAHAVTGDVVLAGATTAGGALALTSGQDTRLAGPVNATGATTIEAGRDLLVDGTLAGQAAGQLKAARDITGAGAIGFARDATLDAAHDVALSGTLQGASVAVTAGNQAGLGSVQALSGDLAVRARGGDATLAGPATAIGAVSIQAARDVRVDGALNAGGAATLSAARSVTTADVNAAGDLTLTATSGALQAGNLTTQHSLAATAGGALTVAGKTVAGGDARLGAGGDLTLKGDIGAQQSGTLKSGGTLTAAAVAFGKEAMLDAAGSLNASGAVTTNGKLTANAGGDLALGSVNAGGATELHARGANGAGDVHVNGSFVSGGTTQVTAARDALFAGTAASDGALSVTAARDLTLRDKVGSGGDLTLSATQGALRVDGTLAAVGALKGSAGTTLTLGAGTLVNGDTNLAAGGDMRIGGPMFGLGGADLKAGGAMTGGALTFAKAIDVAAGGALTLGAIDGAGTLNATSGGDMKLASTSAVGQATLTSRAGGVSVDGLLRSGGDARVQAARDVALAGGVSAMGAVDVDAKGGDATVAGVSSNGDARIHASGKATLSGTSLTVGDLTVTGGDVVMKGSAGSSRNLNIEAQRTLDAGGASLAASKHVQATGRDVTLGSVIAGALDAHADNQLTLVGETVGVVGAANLTSGNGLHNASKVLAGGGLTVSAQNLVNAEKASLASTGATTINATQFTNAGLVNGASTQANVAGALNNAGGALMGVDALKVETGALDNRSGVLFAGNANDPNGAMKGDLSLTIRGGDGALNNASGKLLAQRDIGVNAVNLTFDPSQGLINQRGQLSVTAGFVNIGGNWNYGGQGVTLTGQRGINNGGVMTGTAGLTLNTGGGAFNNYGQVSGWDVTLNGALNNGGGAVMHADNMLALNGNVTNRGTVEAGNVLNVSGWDYDNQGATTQSKGDVNFKLGGTLQNTGGSVFAGRNVSISAGAVVNDQTAPGAAVTTTRDIVDPNLLWSGRVGTITRWVVDRSGGGDHGYTYSAQRTLDASMGDLLSPTGSTSTRYLNAWGCTEATCYIKGTAPVAGSGTVTFGKYGGVYMGTSNGNDVGQAKWAIGVAPGASDSRTFVLPTVHETTTSQQPGISGVISAGNAISLTAGSLSNRGGQIAAQGDISLNVQSLSNGAVAPTTLNQTVRYVDQGQYTEFLKQLVALNPKDNSILGQITAQKAAPIFVRGTGSSMSYLPASTFQIDVNSAAPSSTGTVSSSTPTGLIAAGHDLTVGGGSLVNAGMLYAGRDVYVSAQNLSNQGGNQQNHSGQVGCAAGVPSSACGNAGQPRGNNPVTTGFSYSQSDATIYAGRDLVIAAGKVDNTYGNLLAGRDVVIGGVGTTANSTTPAQTLNNTSGNIIAGNDIKLNVSGAITNKLPPPVPVHENYGKQERYSGCMTAGGYKESYCEGYVDRQSGSTSVISAGNTLDISAGSLTNIGSLIAAGNSASIVVAGPVINEAQTLNAYWHSHWVQETGMFSSDKRHDIWACGSPEQCKALYGSAYARAGGAIDPPTPVGNIAATIQAPNLSIQSNGQIQNVGNVIGTTVVLSGQKLINGITTPNTYTPHVNAPQQVITLSPLTLPGLNLSIPRAVGSGTLPTPVAGRAAYVNEGLGGSAIGAWSPQALLDNLPPSLQPGSTLFYYNPQEENLLLQQAALQQTGKASFVDGLAYDSKHGASVTEQEKGYLYQNAVDYAKRNTLQLGAALTQAQVNQLDRPMLWYVEQTFPDPTCTATGTGVCPTITALMPQVYLPKDITAMSAGGNISGHDVTLKFNQDGQGSILNTGSITAGGTLSVDTRTLTNRANEVNVGEIWQKVDGGYLNTTGTVVQPGGFMSAANMDLNVQALNQIGGALTKLGAEGSVDEAGTKQMLADLQRQLGGNFAQTAVDDHLHQDFVKEGGAFGMTQIFSMAVAIAAAIAMQPYLTAAIGSMSGATAAATEAAFAAAQQGLTGAAITAAASAAGGSLAMGGLANTMIAVGLSSFASSAIGQFVGTGKIDLGSSFRNGLISAATAGLTNGITFNAQTGMPGFSFNAPVDGMSSLASLSGVQNIGSSLVPKAGAAVGQLPAQLAALGANAAIQAGMGSLIGGESFLNGLKNNLIRDAAAAAAFSIGDATDPGTLKNIAAHGALGCAAGAAGGGGCESGALGGVVSAAFTPDFIKAIDSKGMPLDPGQRAAVAAFATLAGGGLAGLTGVDMQGAITAAQNEAMNNASADSHLAKVLEHGGVTGKLLLAAYTALPWLPGNPLTQAMSSTVKDLAGRIPASGHRKPTADEDMLTGDAGKSGNPLTSKSNKDLLLEGTRNGLSVVGPVGGGGPLAPGPGAVAMAGAGAMSPGAAAGAANVAGYGAGNTTLSNGSDTSATKAGDTAEGGGKSRNKPPAPLPEADGLPHTIVERPGADGQYTTHNGDGTWMQYRGSGQDHGGIPRPNVKETSVNVTPDGRVFVGKGEVRPARPDEIPAGKTK
ncbi:polymorphic toxin type 24 domain-containing protein [Burkholderia sp. FERM BP-3421]|uniref:two-partner secretion domain-containing protein n=1 Tax=Burkholderia sp. FERM BP-3421 TaxID=1494466 RepID=UPI002360C949|nr:filamentous hemagglutinin N-terminal domain-containing protein [Burkholderia sp. FERM BP-3421]WDD94484.1 polymorphic toxin type 24 domain-containing protein [Burkholderia sp. FERM BP-3421]